MDYSGEIEVDFGMEFVDLARSQERGCCTKTGSLDYTIKEEEEGREEMFTHTVNSNL